MGMNYYLSRNACPTCGKSEDTLHIGKSSAGWVFALHVYYAEGIKTLDDWIAEFDKPNVQIYDENQTPITAHDMIAIISERIHEDMWNTKPFGYRNWEEFHRENKSEQGPNGLLRSRVDGMHCIGHGDGTWDYYIGTFS